MKALYPYIVGSPFFLLSDTQNMYTFHTWQCRFVKNIVFYYPDFWSNHLISPLFQESTFSPFCCLPTHTCLYSSPALPPESFPTRLPSQGWSTDTEYCHLHLQSVDMFLTSGFPARDHSSEPSLHFGETVWLVGGNGRSEEVKWALSNLRNYQAGMPQHSLCLTWGTWLSKTTVQKEFLFKMISASRCDVFCTLICWSKLC